MTMQKYLLIFLGLAWLPFSLAGQASVLGVWKSIDDNTGEAKSHVEIFEKNGKVFGKIVDILSAEPDVLCDACKGQLKNKPVMGLQIIDGLELNGTRWSKGSILDPESGNTYGCSIWLEDANPDVLRVRGRHWTGLYRTQTWRRVK